MLNSIGSLLSNNELELKDLEYFEVSISKFWKVHTTVVNVQTTIFLYEECFPDSYLVNFFLAQFSGIDLLFLLGFGSETGEEEQWNWKCRWNSAVPEDKLSVLSSTIDFEIMIRYGLLYA